MKILMLCPLLSSSSFLTTYPYAKILSKKHDVKIVGPLFGKKETYVKDKSLNFEFLEPVVNSPVQLGMMSLIPKNISRLLKSDYDVVHTFKLLPHTGPVAAFSKKFTKKPFVLTIDDYDVASPSNPIKRSILKSGESAYKSADAVTVSSKYLQKIYGGEVIYQVANEEIFLRRKYNREQVRKKLNVEDKVVIFHAGTFFDSKGIDILIKAVQSLKREDVVLLLAGYGDTKKIMESAGSETIFLGRLPITEIPKYLAASDIYAIPTKDTLYTRAEIPAKVFEAMMMEKAIVASRLSDIPIILDNGKCGLLTKPGDLKSLTSALSRLVDDRQLRARLGRRSKKRYINNYSYKQIEEKINNIYSKIPL